MSIREHFNTLVEFHRAGGAVYCPSLDTLMVVELLDLEHQKLSQQHDLLRDLLGLFKQLTPLTHLTDRIAHIMQELDDLKAAVAANTDATAGNAALITQQRGTIDTQAQTIKDLQAQIAAGGGGTTITGVDPAELVPLTKQISDNNNALVDATMPPAPAAA